ncbi:hypothetical protein ACN47E_000346 [Coniothyrium glycines]
MSQNLGSRQSSIFRCPSGGTWWACASGTGFVGCCARDPCSITCAAGSLYPAGFDPAAYEKFPDATCGSSSRFYTCTAGNTFLGCCKSNPCSSRGCPVGSLEPAFLASRPDLIEAYSATNETSSKTSSTQSFTSTSTLAPSFHTTASASTASGISSQTSATAVPTQNEHKTPVAAIAGAAAGGAFAVALIIIIFIYFCCRAKKSKEKQTDSMIRGQSGFTDTEQAVAGNSVSQSNLQRKGVYTTEVPPLDYSSPNPNLHGVYGNLNFIAGQNYGYTPQQNFQPYEPQELPIGPGSPMPVQKRAYMHTRNATELSGETSPSEMDTAGSSIQVTKSAATQGRRYRPVPIPLACAQPSPMISQAEFGPRARPMDYMETHHDNHSSVSHAQEQWSAPQNWQSTQSHSQRFGLGVQGLEEDDSIEAADRQRRARPV